MKGALTLFESDRGPLAKRWELKDAAPVKTTAAQMTSGSYSAREFADVHELKALVESVTTHQALCASLPRDGSVSGRVVTQKALGENPAALARAKQHFSLQPRPGVLFVDADQAGITRDALWDMLCDAVLALGSAGVLWRPSGSSHICNGDTDLTGLRGQHLYMLIADASEGPRIIKVITQRLWLAGHGQILVSAVGSLLVRSPIDAAPSDAARLIFAGGADCIAPLEQRRGPAMVLNEGGWLDPRDVPDLSAEEEARFDALVAQAKEAKHGEAAARRTEHRAKTVANRVPALMRAGISASEAESRVTAVIDAAYGGVLLGDFELTIVDDKGKREVVTVAQVLADRDRFHERDCLEPLNPEHRGGSPDARLYIWGTSPILWSLDSSCVYRLRAQQKRITVARGNRSELVSQLVRIVADMDCVFTTDTGPVVIDQGQRWPLTVERLMNLIGGEVALTVKNRTGETPTDLQRDVAALVLAALPHAGIEMRGTA